MRMIVAGLALLTAVLIGADAEAARSRRAPRAHTHYDGIWNITLLVTEGRCIKVSYPAEIRQGRLVYEGFFAVAVDGGISPAGQVAIKLTYKGLSAFGKGRAKNNIASGTWDAPPVQCRGTWTGERAMEVAN